MEAKDTVLEPKDLIRLEYSCETDTDIEASLQKQAEISFKAGYKYAFKGAVMNGAFESIKKLGIQEAVVWMESAMQLERCDPDVMAYFNDYVWIDYQD